jgi:hypothetical protein
VADEANVGMEHRTHPRNLVQFTRFDQCWARFEANEAGVTIANSKRSTKLVPTSGGIVRRGTRFRLLQNIAHGTQVRLNFGDENCEALCNIGLTVSDVRFELFSLWNIPQSTLENSSCECGMANP